MKKIQSRIADMLNTKENIIFKNTLEILEIDNLLKFNFFALGIREIISLFLNNNSDINGIKKCSWYKQYEYNEKARDEVTTKQKLAYIFSGGIDIDIDDIIKNLKINIKDKIDSLEKMYRGLNKYTHINKILSEENILNESKEILSILEKFLTEFNSFRKVCKKYEERIYCLVDEKITIDTLSEFYEIATHYYDPMISYYKISKINFTNDKMLIKVKGNINSKIQYGSDGDCRRGDGVIDGVEFPFEAIIELNTTDFLNEDIDSDMLEITKLNIDNSQFFE